MLTVEVVEFGKHWRVVVQWANGRPALVSLPYRTFWGAFKAATRLRDRLAPARLVVPGRRVRTLQARVWREHGVVDA